MANTPLIAFQGMLGAYSESACLHLYGRDCRVLPCEKFEQAFAAVEAGRADAAVLPVENSTTGSIHQNIDNLLHHQLHIVGEVKLQIEHSLMAPRGVTLERLTGVRSHPQALAQCSQFFADHPQVRELPDFDTAGSAEIAAREQGTIGAIASALAAEEYGLEILQSNLENQKGVNFTRFFALSREPAQPPKAQAKCSLIFEPQHNGVGVLHQALQAFAEAEIDLVKIESRPKLGSPWEYLFYLDFRGSSAEPRVQQALAKLQAASSWVRLLGCYPEGESRKLFTSRKG